MYLQDFLGSEDGKKVTKINKDSCTYNFFYNYWRDILFERVMRLFIWDGVGDSLPVKEIEKYVSVFLSGEGFYQTSIFGKVIEVDYCSLLTNQFALKTKKIIKRTYQIFL